MKTVEEIYREMRAEFQERTGAEIGASGDMAVRLYAAAAQVYGLYVQADWVLRQCFPQTAQGEYLDQHAALRGVSRQQAHRAEGVLRFTVRDASRAGHTVPEGTVCMTAGMVRFETTEAGTIPVGGTQVEVRARAVEPGESGNVAANSITIMAVAPVGIYACTNSEAFTGGREEEDDEALRSRVLDTFRRLPNGANAAFYQQGAMSFPEVAAVTVVPRPRGVGSVDVVVATPTGVPESGLLEKLTKYFQARREIAVDVQVKAPTVKTVAVTAALTVGDGYDPKKVASQAKAMLRDWFGGERLGRDVLRAELTSKLFALPGVVNCALSAPAADVAVADTELPALGELTVTAEGGV